jgi:hypothetical protein
MPKRKFQSTNIEYFITFPVDVQYYILRFLLSTDYRDGKQYACFSQVCKNWNGWVQKNRKYFSFSLNVFTSLHQFCFKSNWDLCGLEMQCYSYASRHSQRIQTLKNPTSLQLCCWNTLKSFTHLRKLSLSKFRARNLSFLTQLHYLELNIDTFCDKFYTHLTLPLHLQELDHHEL